VSVANTKRAVREVPRLVWITRARPGADVTAERVRKLGIEAIVTPLLEVRRAPPAPIDLVDVSAIAFTSANAVAAFAERSTERALRVFAVGDATAAAARAQRFSNVLSAQGDVSALAAALAARRRELPGLILYPAAADPAQDLAGALGVVGLNVRQITLYETVVVEPDEAAVARLAEIDAVLLHSAKAARALTGFLKTHPCPGLTAYCLSRPIARSLSRAGLARVIAAATPTEAALLAELTAGAR
jgi:uroporphyrinogen-III synthase